MARKQPRGRPEKKAARRERPKIETDTYTSAELCAKYGCAQVTIRRKEREEGFPKGEKFGRKLIYAKAAVHEWERKHMPKLHNETDESDEDKQWSLLRRRYLLEKEERAAGVEPEQPPPKPRRPPVRARA